LTTVSEFYQVFDELYPGFTQFDSLHGDDIDELNESTGEANLMLSGGRFTDPRKYFEKVRNQIDGMQNYVPEATPDTNSGH